MANRKELLKTINKLTKGMNAFDWFPKSEDDGENAKYYLTEKQMDVVHETFRLLREMKFLLKMQDFKTIEYGDHKAIESNLFHGDCGALVKIRPCDDDHAGKTYMGFLIGDVSLSVCAKLTDNAVEVDYGYHNPAIFVPELKKIVYGNESWWQEIESEKDFSDITDSDINAWLITLSQKGEKNESDND